MKFLFHGKFLILWLIFATNQLIAQNWTLINPLPTNANYAHINVVNENESLFATSDGEIFRTDNGGSSLESVYKGVDFIDMEMINEKEGFALENYPYNIIKTTDGGINWDVIGSVFINYCFPNDMCFADSLNGWIVGAKNSVFRTQNGGVSWQKLQDNGNYHYAFQTCSFISKDTGMIAGGSFYGFASFYKTYDGGETLIPLNIPDGGGIEKIFMKSSSDIWLLGHFTNGQLAHSTNGGDNWTIHNICDPFSNCLTLTFFGDQHIRVTTDVGVVFSDDYGQTWTEKTIFDNYYSFIVGAWSSPYACYIAGYYGMLLKSQNKGENWDKLYSGIIADLTSVDFYDSEIGCVAGESEILSDRNNPGIYSTSNGGAIWYEVYTDSLINGIIKDIQFVDRNIIWACDNKGIVYNSTDGGSTWNADTIPMNGYNQLNSIFANIDGTIYVGGNKLYKSNNNGLSWEESLSIPDASFPLVDMVDSLNCFIESYFQQESYSLLYYTNNGGLTWQYVDYFGSRQLINALDFYNSQLGIIAMEGIGTWITQDGCNTWIKADLPNSVHIVYLKFFDCENLVAVDDWERVYYSFNGGLNWTLASERSIKPDDFEFSDINYNNLSGTFNKYDFSEMGLGWHVDYNGLIKKYYDPCVSNRHMEEVPNYLFELTPNPVKDIIKIDGQRMIDKIEVINTAGQSVMLMNNIEHSLNLQALPTGSYLVVIYSDNIREVHKIIKE